MEKRLELRLCLFSVPGLWSFFSASCRGFGAVGGGSDVECECEGVLRTATGLGGLLMVDSGRGASHISQAVRFGWLRKVHRGHCFLRSGVDGRATSGSWTAGRGRGS